MSLKINAYCSDIFMERGISHVLEGILVMAARRISRVQSPGVVTITRSALCCSAT